MPLFNALILVENLNSLEFQNLAARKERGCSVQVCCETCSISWTG